MMPPELGQMAAPPMMPGMPSPVVEEPPVEEPELDPVESLRNAIEFAQAAQIGEPDDEDSRKLAKVVADMYAILAARQKERDQTMGNPTLLRTLRRSGGA